MVAAGDQVIAVADVDPIYIGVRVLLCLVKTMERLRSGSGVALWNAGEIHRTEIRAGFNTNFDF